MKHNANTEVMEGTSIKNLTIPSGIVFPTSPNLGEVFWLLAALPGFYPGKHEHTGLYWQRSAPLHFVGASAVPVMNMRVWHGITTVVAGRWSLAIPVGIFKQILNVQATAGTSGTTANDANFASVDFESMTVVLIAGICTDSDPAGGDKSAATGQFSPNGVKVHVTVTGT